VKDKWFDQIDCGRKKKKLDEDGDEDKIYIVYCNQSVFQRLN